MIIYKQPIPRDKDVRLSFVVLAVSSLLVLLYPWTVIFALPITWDTLLRHGWIGRRYYEKEKSVYIGGRWPSEFWKFRRVFPDDGCGYPEPYYETDPVPSNLRYVKEWRNEVRRMPPNIQNLFPDLYMSETSVAGFVGGVPLYGVVDQVFRDKEGKYVIVDTKSHYGSQGPSASDMLQMSVYRAILVQKFGEEMVSKTAYVREVDTSIPIDYEIRDNSTWWSVTLLPTSLVAECARKLTKIRHTRPFKEEESANVQTAG